MLAKIYTAAIVGLDGQLIEVEVDLLPGLPAVNVVGLPDTAVQEARERVRSAVRNSGCAFPNRRITVSLAPADIRKEGPSFDLPIAVGIVIASEQVVADTTRSLFLGELSLDGRLRSTHGVLPMASLAREAGLTQVFVPSCDAAEAALVEGIDVYPLETFPPWWATSREISRSHPLFVATSRSAKPIVTTAPISPRYAARSTSNAPLRSQPPVATTS